MYEQIARNKRRSVAYLCAFLIVWLGIGALIGALAATTVTRQPGAASPIMADVLAGVAVAAVLALTAVMFTLRSGTRLVLTLAGGTRRPRAARPAVQSRPGAGHR